MLLLDLFKSCSAVDSLYGLRDHLPFDLKPLVRWFIMWCTYFTQVYIGAVNYIQESESQPIVSRIR